MEIRELEDGRNKLRTDALHWLPVAYICKILYAGQTLMHGDQFISLYPAAGVTSLPAINGAYGIGYSSYTSIHVDSIFNLVSAVSY